MQVFDNDQLHLINKGKMYQDVLRTQIQEALFNNPFNENYIISSLPGLGKSHETDSAIQTMSQKPLRIDGNAGMIALTVDIATALYLAGGNKIAVVLDDCDVLFEDKNANTTKKMFDQSRVLKYGKNWRRGFAGMTTDLQWEALESFARDDRAGLEIPTNNITFLVLTNRYLHTINDVDGMDAGTKKHSVATDLYGIRRRVEYKPIEMNTLELWGYVANVVLNEKICEKFKPNITDAEKAQQLEWMFNKWANVTERNLSLAEKMTKDMVRYPKNYKDIWAQNYLQVK
jgi:hypothetical protein